MRATTRISLCILAAGALALTASAATKVNERTAHIGYAYPAGGQRGTTVEVLVGGQYLRGVNAALVSGKGVHATVEQYYPPVRMLKREQRDTLMKELDDARNKRVAELGIKGPVPLFPGESFARQRLADAKRAAAEAARKAAAEKSAGKSPDKPAAKPAAKDAKPARQPAAAQNPSELPPSPYLRDIDKMSLRQLMTVADTFLNFRVNARRETNPQLTDTVLLKVTIDPDAALGNRELRLAAPLGLTNPIYFQVGALPEVREQEPDEPYRTAKLPPLPPFKLPVVVNGQILPGDVDTFHFDARKGQHLVIETFARQLIPFLADAVPGWFQPAVTLYDPQGKEVAFADHYEFHPDPVLLYDVPQDGTYALEVRDTIYRGREDFVYRIAIGELPFITSAFPLGARAGSKAETAVEGWNLPSKELPLDTSAGDAAVRDAFFQGKDGLSNAVSYAVDDLPEVTESEPNDDAAHAQAVELPVVANGRIGKPGDVDVYKIQGHAGEQVVADVVARRVGSPLDSLVRVIDSSGKVVGLDDDYMPTDGYLHPDMGVITHEADSYLQVKLPADGAYYVQVSDAQGHGGPAYAYRVRISTPRPDFRLLMDPSSLVLAPGASAKVTVHVLRQDGFAGGVDVALKDAPRGVGLAGGKIPADKESAEMRITAQAGAPVGPVDLQLEGSAQIDGKSVTRPVTPADDEMQAFLWRHLVPSQELVALVRPGRGQFGRGARNGRRPQLPRGIKPPSTVKVPAGGSAEVRFNFPGAVRAAGLLHLELVNPPEGVSISKVHVVPGGVTFELKAEGKAATVGHKGKLTVEAFAQRPNGPRRFSLGRLPAFSFEVVKP